MPTTDKLIIWCGDSWSYGTGLGIDKKKIRFPTLTSHALDAQCINLSRPGTSIGHLVYKFRQIKRIYHTFNHSKKIVFFGLTVPYRLCIANDHGPPTTVSVNDFDLCGYKDWAHHIFNNKHIIDDTCIKLSWLAEQCHRHQINFKFYNILCNRFDFEKSSFCNFLNESHWLVNDRWSTYSELFDIDNFNFSRMGVLEKTSFGRIQMQKYTDHSGHPNREGHAKISQKLIHAIAPIF